MFRSLVILLLVNSYGRGLGKPLNQSAPIIAYSLGELAKSCQQSKFLVNEISSHLQECNVTFVKPHAEKQLQCTLFYDISAQLCAAVSANKLELTQDDYTAKLSDDMSITDLCKESKHWNLTDLPNYPSYKPSLSKVFSNDLFCGRLCGGPDVFDVNYYCKFYKWGTDILKPPVVPISQSGIEAKVEPSLTGVEDTKIQPSAASSTTKANETQATELQKSIPNEPSAPNKKLPTNIEDPAAKVDETVSVGNQELPSAAVGNPELPSNVNAAEPILTSSSKDHEEADNDLPAPEKDAHSNASNVEISNNEETGQKMLLSDLPVNKVKVGLLSKDLEAEADKTGEGKAVIEETPKLNLGVNPDPDDYQDSDEGKEGLLDLQNADDSIDPAIGDLNEAPYPQPTKPPAKKIVAPILSSFNGESQRDLYPSMQDTFLDEQEDSFFPFFLTAVILVVLIYVLYHNKSKVSKVVLGLIVEGRQPGRRRNSRGHSYRRLDTLEQAMSSNTAAAPSKIIY